MPSPYSYDLRIRVIKFIEEKNSIKAASVMFKIHRKTIMEWKKLKKETGDVRSKEGYQVGHRKIITEIDRFKELVEKNNDKSSQELSEMWHQKISASAIKQTLRKLGYSYKKNFCSSEKGRWSQG